MRGNEDPLPPFTLILHALYLNFTSFDLFSEEPKRGVSKRVVRSDVPPERKPERGYVRQNHPFTKPPFYLPVIFLSSCSPQFWESRTTVYRNRRLQKHDTKALTTCRAYSHWSFLPLRCLCVPMPANRPPFLIGIHTNHCKTLESNLTLKGPNGAVVIGLY